MLVKNKYNIHYVQDDIFESIKYITSSQNKGATVIVPHVCNNIGVANSGFMSAINNHYSQVSANFELLGKKIKLGYVQYIDVFKDPYYDHQIVFANMIAQNGLMNKKNSRPLNYEFLIKCMVDVRNFAKNMGKDRIEIHCPKFGGGLAGGNWNFIHDIITDIWSDFEVFIHIYRK